MHPPTHALLSWLLAEAGGLEHRRDRGLVLAAGLLPDLDGLSILFGQEAYLTWHRILLHHGVGAAGIALLTAAVARARLRTAALALVSTHLHFVCDMLGSAGPDGSIWRIPYLVPFDMAHPGFAPAWQWGLASWQNVSITVLCLVACAVLGVRRGRTILEPVSLRADRAVVEVLRRRFGGLSTPAPAAPAPPPPPPHAVES